MTTQRGLVIIVALSPFAFALGCLGRGGQPLGVRHQAGIPTGNGLTTWDRVETHPPPSSSNAAYLTYAGPASDLAAGQAIIDNLVAQNRVIEEVPGWAYRYDDADPTFPGVRIRKVSPLIIEVLAAMRGKDTYLGIYGSYPNNSWLFQDTAIARSVVKTVVEGALSSNDHWDWPGDPDYFTSAIDAGTTFTGALGFFPDVATADTVPASGLDELVQFAQAATNTLEEVVPIDVTASPAAGGDPRLPDPPAPPFQTFEATYCADTVDSSNVSYHQFTYYVDANAGVSTAARGWVANRMGGSVDDGRCPQDNTRCLGDVDVQPVDSGLDLRSEPRAYWDNGHFVSPSNRVVSGCLSVFLVGTTGRFCPLNECSAGTFCGSHGFCEPQPAGSDGGVDGGSDGGSDAGGAPAVSGGDDGGGDPPPPCDRGGRGFFKCDEYQ